MLTPRDRLVDTSDGRVHALEYGLPSHTKLSVVLLHGFCQTAHSWDEFGAALAARGLHAVAISSRGHGKTFWSKTGDYSRESMVADVATVTTSLGLPRFALIGLSMGGAIAVMFAAEHATRVAALGIVDWAPWPEDSGPPTGVLSIGAIFAHKWATFDEAVEMMNSFNPRRTRANTAARLRQQLMCNADGKWVWATDPAIVGSQQLKAKEPASVMWDAVARVRCPALLVRGGASDVLAPAQA